MKSISVKVSSKHITTLFVTVGLFFWLAAWYISQMTNNTTTFLFSLNDIQIEHLYAEGIDSKEIILTGETLRDISSRFNKYNDYGAIGLIIAGGLFLLLSLALSVYDFDVSDKV